MTGQGSNSYTNVNKNHITLVNCYICLRNPSIERIEKVRTIFTRIYSKLVFGMVYVSVYKPKQTVSMLYYADIHYS